MRAIVVGIGNPHIEEDSAGIRVAEMAEMSLAETGVDVAFLSTTSFEVIDRILGYDRAYIIDTLMGEGHGRIHVFRIEPGRPHGLERLEGVEGAGGQLYASHALSLATTLKLGFELFPDEMPQIELIAIEIAQNSMETRSTESDAIEKAFHMLQQKILAVMSSSDSEEF